MLATTLRPPMRKAQRNHHNVVTIPPPTGGIDSISPLAQMPPVNAVELDNLISQDGGVALRKGWYDYATHVGPGEPVRTVMSYDAAPINAVVSPLTESELFAACDHGIHLVEGGGDMTGEPAMIALSGSPDAGRFSFVQFTAQGGGNYLVACSEIDGAFLYDGVSWMKMVLGGSGPGHITGRDPAFFVQVVSWKKRLIFVERSSTSCWVLDVGAVGGTVLEFDFGPLLGYGGCVLALLNWTQDAGSGIDDRLVVLGSAGDLAVYEGTDPTNINAFRNVGVWYLGQMPVGRRNFTNSGGNIYVLSQYGLIPVSQIVQGGLDNVLTSSTQMLKQLRNLQEQFTRDFQTKINREGWEVLDIPAEVGMIILRPKITTIDHVSYFFQMTNLAWSRLLDIPAITVYQRLSEVYAGTEDGRVIRIFDGYSDGKKFDGSGAIHVRGKATPAFSYFGDPSVLKQALMVKPTFLSSGTVDYVVDMNTDFYVRTDVPSPIETTPSGSLWNSARWDQSYWAPAFVTHYEWRNVAALGYALTPSVFMSAQSRTVLTSVELMLRAGGPLL